MLPPFSIGVIVASAFLYESDSDRRLYFSAVQMLAKELDIPEEEIRIFYERMLCSLKEKARITDYLVILVSRRVKDTIRGDMRSRTS
jgi:hypothetical protein